MTSCLTAAQIQGLLDRSLPAEELREVEAHIAECDRCRDRVAEEISTPDLAESSAESETYIEYAPTATITDAPPPSVRGPGRSGAPSSPEEFTRTLLASGLVTDEEFTVFQQEELAGREIADAGALADTLVSSGKLTPYQAEEIKQGNSRGLVLGNYVILDRIGEGGMGMVFRARHRRMKRIVALKVLPPALTRSEDAVHRFHREMEAAAKLTHANIAAAYDADEAEGIHFMVMEYIEGPNLSALVKQVGPLPLPVALQLITQAARGLAHAHKQGVVHRDIKPGNLLVNQQGCVKILDMGLAQLHSVDDEARTELTQSGRVMGTVDYMAPEQAIDAKSVDARADIYSLGCTLFYLLTGRPMAPEGTLTQKLLWHQSESAPSLKEFCPEVSEGVELLYRRMLAKKPADRQASMEEVVHELEGILAEMSASDLKLPELDITLYNGAPSTDGGADSGLRTFVARRTRTDLGSPPPAAATPQGRRAASAWLAGGVLLLGAITVGAVAAGAFLLGATGNRGVLVVTLEAPGVELLVDGRPRQVVEQAGSVELELPAGALRVEGRKADHEPALWEGTLAAGERRSINLTPRRAAELGGEPARRPVEQLLQWALERGGRAEIVNAAGDIPIFLERAAAVPRGSFEVRGLQLEGLEIAEGDLARLTAAPTLQRLSLAGSRFPESELAELGKLRELMKLDLSGAAVSNSGLGAVARLGQLRELNLQDTPVTGPGLARLAGLPKLQKLYLSDTKVRDADVEQLTRLESLEYLALNGTLVTEAGFNSLTTALPRLQIAWDGSDLDLAAANRLLGKGAALTVRTRSGDELPVTRKADLPVEPFHLIAVDLSTGRELGADDLKTLAGLEQIARLQLGGSGIGSAGLSHLHGLTTLREIDLGAGEFSTASVAALRRALPEAEVKQRERSDLAYARMTLERGGKVVLETADGDRLEITELAKLPEGRFTLRELHFPAEAGVANDDLTQLAELPGLESLYLSGNPVTNAGLEHVAGCRGLRELSLSDSLVTGEGVEKLSGLTQLQRLYLAGLPLSGESLRSVAALPNLTHLSLGRTPVEDADLPLLRALPQLSWLSLADTAVSDAAIPRLKEFPRLAELVVERTAVTHAGLDELRAALPRAVVLGDPPSPQRLAAAWVLAAGGFVETESQALRRPADLPRGDCRVAAIDLAELPRLDEAALARHLASCSELERLNLYKSNAGNAALAAVAKCPKLTHVTLASTPITDAGLASLAGLAQLQVLDLRGTSVTGQPLAEFASTETLVELHLGNTRLNSLGLAAVGRFPELRALDLSNNLEVTDRRLTAIAPLGKLEQLNLRGTQISDAGLDLVAAFPVLTQLDLGNNQLTDSGLARLTDLKKLRDLSIYGNPRAGNESLAALAPLPELRILNAGRTAADERGAEAFRQARAAAKLPACDLRVSIGRPEDEERNRPGGGRPGGGRPGGGAGPLAPRTGPPPSGAQ